MEEAEPNSPWLRASAVRTFIIEVFLHLQQRHLLGVPFALDRKTVIELSCLAELLHKGGPHLATFPAAHESTGIADYYEAVTGSGE